MSVLKLPGLALRAGLMSLFLSVPVYLALQNFAFLEPFLYPLHLMQATPARASPGLLLGPYPDHSQLAGLRGKGYKTVVSLLTPDRIYERSLIESERRNAKSLGIAFYNFPMNSDLPVTSNLNARAIESLDRLLARSPGQPFYIHCYLGKHRSGMVAQWLRVRDSARVLASATNLPLESAPTSGKVR